jgi:FKBP-type peptidyl-prolyl cis-trans isomerase
MHLPDVAQNTTAGYPYTMIKALAGVIVIILIAGGVYWYMNMSSDATTPIETTETEQTSSPQVAGQDAIVGTGAEATPGSVVSILYVGMLEDGTVFDSSANNNNEPLTFTLGTPGIIPGFQIGVNGMREGGERRIQIPAELGYGAQEVKDANDKVIVPANSTLVFDVKLVSVASSSPAE